MARKSKEQKAAEEAAKAAAAANGDESGGTATQTQPGASSKKEVNQAASVVGIIQRNHLILQNTSRNIQIIPLDGDKQRRLLPNESWDVEGEHLEAVRSLMKTPYFKSLEELGHYKVRDVQPSRLGEQELVAPETPEPPEELTKKPEPVTQAEFIKDKDGE